MSDFSRGSQPLEKDDISCGQGFAFRRPDGTVIVRWQPCDTKACEACGPRLRATWAAQWAHAMGGDRVRRLVVADGEVAKLRRRKVMRGHEVGVIPGPDGRRVVYTTAPIGEPVTVGDSLTSDFAAMPSDRRNRSLSKGWRAVIGDMEAEAASSREPWECLGRVGVPQGRVVMVAEDLGVLVARTSDTVVVAAMDPATWGTFAARVRLQRGRHRRQVAA
jgi:hypothetical protein